MIHDIPNFVAYLFLSCQLFVVVCIALNEWMPSRQRQADSSAAAPEGHRKLFFAAMFGALPYGVGLAATARYAATGFPSWLMWWLWITYGSAVFGMLRAWWVPYLTSRELPGGGDQAPRPRPDPFVPAGTVIRLGIVQVTLHAVATLTLVLLGVMTFAGRAIVAP